MADDTHPTEQRGALRRNVYEIYMNCCWKSQEVSGILSGEGGNLRGTTLDLRKLFGTLLLYTSYDKAMSNANRERLEQIAYWLAYRVNDNTNMNKYARVGLRHFEWYSSQLLQRGIIVIEGE